MNVLKNGDKYLEILLKNGESFSVKGDSINDVPNGVIHRKHWSSFELLSGNQLQVWSEDISAIYERTFIIDNTPF